MREGGGGFCCIAGPFIGVRSDSSRAARECGLNSQRKPSAGRPPARDMVAADIGDASREQLFFETPPELAY